MNIIIEKKGNGPKEIFQKWKEISLLVRNETKIHSSLYLHYPGARI